MTQDPATVRTKIRLYVPDAYGEGTSIVLPVAQSHYVAQVMRGRVGDNVAVFNGRDGQWLATIDAVEKKAVTLRLIQKQRNQIASPDLWLVFAPIKNKTDIVIEKAVELGVSKLVAVFTRYAVVRTINHDKLVAHTVEASEQCERLDVPVIEEYKDMQQLLAGWPQDRTLLYGDESGSSASLPELLPELPAGNYAVLVGPEGGFSQEEHQMLRSAPFVKGFSMGPRILRADTAAIAALACIQAHRGDWILRPHFQPQG